MDHQNCCAKSLQSCLTLCDPKDCCPPGSSVQGFLQERAKGVAVPSSRGIFPNQESNLHVLHFLHWQANFYQRYLGNMVHQRKEWQSTPVFFPQSPHEQCKRQKTLHQKMGPPPRGGKRSPINITGEEQRAITNSSVKNEETWPKWKQCSVVDVFGGESLML